MLILKLGLLDIARRTYGEMVDDITGEFDELMFSYLDADIPPLPD
jgi:hypothetical protein